jgi:hypothetical protein
MSNSTEKLNELEIACNDYLSAAAEIHKKIDFEICRAFLAGVAFGIEKAQEFYKPKS